MCFFKWQNYISKCFTRSICAYILHESVETKHVRGFTIKSYWRWIVTDNVNKLCVREKRICWAKPNIHLKSRACQGSNKLMRYLLTSWFNFMWGEGLLRNFGARVRLWSLEEDSTIVQAKLWTWTSLFIYAYAICREILVTWSRRLSTLWLITTYTS